MARRANQPTSSNGSTDPQPGSAILTGVILGIGIMSFLDEVIFHELLQWHSFYWHTDQHGRILSDGLLHLVSSLIILWGAVRLWRDRRSYTAARSNVILAGTVIGLGFFQLSDGIVDHAIFHFHLVNEHVCPTLNADNTLATCSNDIAYEVIWDLVGLLLLAAGIVWWRRLPVGESDQRAAQ